MPVWVTCQSATLDQFAASFRCLFSKPQFKYFVTVLLGLIECQERRTLCGLLRQVAEKIPLWGLSRFLTHAPWSVTALAEAWQARFRSQMAAQVQAEHARQRALRPRLPGHPKATVVTGCLILDDSTHEKPRGRKMLGLGRHHSTTKGKRVTGHSLMTGLYILLGRSCPLEPQMYRQKVTCQSEGQPFASKIDLAIRMIETFQPVAGTRTHVLLDSWYMCKRVRRATKRRGFALSGGIKNNRRLRVRRSDGTTFYQKLSEYAAQLLPLQFQPLWWPSQAGDRPVWVHMVRTHVAKFGPCQILVVRESWDPQEKPRFFVTTLLEADAQAVVDLLAVRWNIETMFEDDKELLGSDHYQVMSDKAILRFWALVACLHFYLDEERARLRLEWGRQHVTLGEVRTRVQKTHELNMLSWIHQECLAGASPTLLQAKLAPHPSVQKVQR